MPTATSWSRATRRTTPTLRAAGIERARGLISTIDSDAQNVYVILSARAINRSLLVVGRAGTPSAEEKLALAGADRIVSPYTMAGRRLAELAIRPRVVDFLDAALSHGELSFSLEELHVTTRRRPRRARRSPGSGCAGCSCSPSSPTTAATRRTRPTIAASRSARRSSRRGRRTRSARRTTPTGPGDARLTHGAPLVAVGVVACRRRASWRSPAAWRRCARRRRSVRGGPARERARWRWGGSPGSPAAPRRPRRSRRSRPPGRMAPSPSLPADGVGGLAATAARGATPPRCSSSGRLGVLVVAVAWPPRPPTVACSARLPRRDLVAPATATPTLRPLRPRARSPRRPRAADAHPDADPDAGHDRGARRRQPTPRPTPRPSGEANPAPDATPHSPPDAHVPPRAPPRPTRGRDAAARLHPGAVGRRPHPPPATAIRYLAATLCYTRAAVTGWR